MSKTFKMEATVLAAAIGAILVLPERAAAQELEEVVVTGTRIQRSTGFTSPVPVTTISNDELQALAPGNTLAESLDVLPQFFNSDTAQRGGHAQFSGGRSSLDMRGMGQQRTLVLIDGARTVPADISSNVNIDFIPSALIERVDVVTGGASAAYGADALAGVTNFVLNREFEGFRADVSAGRYDAGDGDNYEVALTGGTAFGDGDRWHVTFSVESQQIDQIRRDVSLGWDPPAYIEQNLGRVANPEWTPGAPASVPRQIVLPHVFPTDRTVTGIINGASRRDDPLDPISTPVNDFPYFRHVFTIDGTSTFPFPYGEAGCYRGDPNSPSPICTINTTAGGPLYSWAERDTDWGIFGMEVVRNNAFLGIVRDFGDDSRVFAHVIYGVSESNDWDHLRAPVLRSPWSATVFRDNAYLPEAIRDAMDATGATELRVDISGKIRGPGFQNWNDSQDSLNKWTTTSVALGFEHGLGDSGNWQLSGNFQRGMTRKSGAMYREARVDRIFLGMDAVEVYPDHRDVDGDGVVDLIDDADRGMGEIICNVNRYNPTPEELQASVIGVDEGGTRVSGTVLVPAAFGDDSLGAPEEGVRIPGPVATIREANGSHSIDDCVPFNVMGTGHTSIEAADYLVSDKWNVGAVTQEFAEIVLTGDVAEGIGAGSFALATGVSYRKETFWQRSLPRELMAFGPVTNAPQIGIRGVSAGWAGANNVHLFNSFGALTGDFDVTELFAELDLPLLRTERGRSISTNLAARRSDYALSGAIDSHKIGLDFGITEALRFRTTISRDVREPTFSERFDVAGGGVTIDDPFTGIDNFFTIRRNLGNPALRPEEADTITGGIVYSPQTVSGLQVAVDYYEIDLTGMVDLLPFQEVIDVCWETRDTTRTYCDFIERDADTQLIAAVNNRYVNIASSFVSGVDLEVLWNTEVDFFDGPETFNMRLLAGWLNENTQTPYGASPEERAGSDDYPDFSALLTLGYTVGPYSVRLLNRYIPETIANLDWHYRPMESCGAAACVPDTTIDSMLTTNLTVGYQQELANGSTWQASLIVSNLFDTDPPVHPYGGTLNRTYNPYGRQFRVRFGYNF
jgi:iron complex outermembrane receptor protein